MLTFISCAKTMAARTAVKVPLMTVPQFGAEAVQNALDMGQFSAAELERLLRVNSKLAAENYLRYQDFFSEANAAMPALCAYTGAVFKRILPKEFSEDDFLFAQEHLRITSFLYGLLRPLDGIKPYRLEGDVRLPERGGRTMFEFWRPLLTDCFIEEIQCRGGVLINLASGEMKDLFDWKRVEASVRIVTPEFQVMKGGQLKTIVIYAKMCRGEMVRYIIKNRIENPDDLKAFTWEGFAFDEERATEGHLQFTLV